jgi:hypothetical protein
MKLKLSRKSVYVATIVAMFAMLGGLALAGTLGGITGTSSNQNAGIINPSGTSTIFAGAVSVNLVQSSTVAGCGSGASWGTTISGLQTPLSVYAEGTNVCTNGESDWFELVQWTGVAVTGTASDTFYITTSGGTTPNTVSFVVSSSGASGTGALDVYLDCGTTAGGALPTAYTAISIAVNGT